MNREYKFCRAASRLAVASKLILFGTGVLLPLDDVAGILDVSRGRRFERMPVWVLLICTGGFESESLWTKVFVRNDEVLWNEISIYCTVWSGSSSHWILMETAAALNRLEYKSVCEYQADRCR